MSSRILNLDIYQIIREIYRKVDYLMFPISNKYDLTIMKTKVLLEIFNKGTLSIGELGNSLGIAGGNISNMCKTLEKEGYLNRTRSTEDERVVTVKLTEVGHTTIQSILNETKEKFANQAAIPDEEFNNLMNGLDSLNKYLDILVTINDK